MNLPEAELISTGSELLSGGALNRHTACLGAALREKGVLLVRETTVPDRKEAIIDALRGALRRVKIVFVGGGLGPTQDDITREAVAEYLGRRLVIREQELEDIRRKMAVSGRVAEDMCRRQAETIEGGRLLPNPVGVAPGIKVDTEDASIFLMPGPPDEFEAILRTQVLTFLGGARNILREHIFMVGGMREVEIAAHISGAVRAGVEVYYRPASGRVELVLESSSLSEEEFGESVAAVRRCLGRAIYAETRVGLESVVGNLLRRKGRTLATAESCTAGMLSARITSVSGSSKYFVGGVTAYRDRLKVAELMVSQSDLERHGAVSATVARQMASGVRKRFHADYGVSITGIAGPEGGSVRKPVGLVFIAVAGPSGIQVERNMFGGGRERVREWSVVTALNMLRLLLEVDEGTGAR